MKNIINLLLIPLAILTLLPSCAKQLLGEEKPNTPASNFETLWSDFDEHYGTFITKGIDWQAQYVKFRSQINDSMSNLDLFNTLKQMLDVLDDNHIFLRPTKETGLPWYSGGILGRTKVEDYNKSVAQGYLIEKTKYNSSLEYGFFQDNIGYINILNFDNNIDTYYKAMDEILDKLKDTKGIVIELRENGGGEDRVSQYVANRFASEKHLSFTSRLRNGPGHNDFGDPIIFYTEPQGNYQYTKPVVMLTDLNTFSSGETFVLAMLQNKNVTQVGDVTGGALADAIERELPNGWSYRLPISDVRDANGKNLEQIGIQPKFKVISTKSELAAGHDKMMEKAIELLK